MEKRGEGQQLNEKEEKDSRDPSDRRSPSSKTRKEPFGGRSQSWSQLRNNTMSSNVVQDPVKVEPAFDFRPIRVKQEPAEEDVKRTFLLQFVPKIENIETQVKEEREVNLNISSGDWSSNLSSQSEEKRICSNCSLEYVNRTLGINFTLCPSCRKWDHCYHFSAKLCNRTESEECFYCLKLKEKAPKAEYLLEKKSSPDEVASLQWMSKRREEILKVLIQENGSLEGYLNEAPEGQWKEWTFYWNIFHPETELNVKLGDCVYLRRENGQGVDMVRVQYLIRDEEGIPWISCYHFYSSDQISRYSTQPVHPQQRWLVKGNGWAPLSTVLGICCCLTLTEYEEGKPRSFLEKDIYFVRHEYEPRTMVQILLTQNDYFQCQDSLVYEKRAKNVRLEMKRETEKNRMRMKMKTEMEKRMSKKQKAREPSKRVKGKKR